MAIMTARPADRFLLAIVGIMAIAIISRLNLEGVLPLTMGVAFCGIAVRTLLRASSSLSYTSQP